MKKEKMKKYKIVFIVLAMNVFSMIVLYLFWGISYIHPQDIYMYDALYDKQLPLIFYNNIFGIMLRKLINSFPNIIFSWPNIITYAMVFISFSIITYVIIAEQCNKINFFLTIGFLLIFGYECYCVPTYMKSAILVVTTSCLLLSYLYMKECNNMCMYFFSVFWGLLGGLFCTSVYYILNIIYILIIIVSAGKKIKGNDKLLMCIVAGFILMLVLSIIDNELYNRTKDENNFVHYRLEIVKLFNYGWPEYTLYGNEMMEYGITEEKYLDIINHYNETEMSDYIIHIYKLKNKLIVSYKALAFFIRKIAYNLFHSKMILISLQFLIIYVLSKPKIEKRKLNLYFLILLFFLMGVFWIKISVFNELNLMLSLLVIVYVVLNTKTHENIQKSKALTFINAIWILILMNISW